MTKRLKEEPMKRVNLGEIMVRVLAAGFLLAVYPLSGAISAEAASVSSNAVACQGGSVYTVDHDPNGTNVRSAPQKDSPVLFAIPYDFEGTVVALSASSGDWVLIHSAQGATSGFESQKEGWVYSRLLAVRAANPAGRKVPLYSKPDTRSAVIKMLASETEGRLAGCVGSWRQVWIGNEKGWLAPGDSCGNPVTTCP
jgi:SH3-like domain-containing protein